MVEGKLINRNYTGKGGVKHYVTEVQANKLLILSKKQFRAKLFLKVSMGKL